MLLRDVKQRPHYEINSLRHSVYRRTMIPWSLCQTPDCGPVRSSSVDNYARALGGRKHWACDPSL